MSIINTNYKSILKSQVQENPQSKTSNSEKVQKYLKLIYAPDSKISIIDDENQQVRGSVEKLLALKPGRMLFRAFLKSTFPYPLTITVSKDKSPHCLTDKVVINHLGMSEVLLNEKGEKILVYVPEEIVLAHEICHAKHYFESAPSKATVDPLVDDELDNLEEQRTILGLKKAKDSYLPEDIELCENHFLVAMGFDIRINHRGVDVPPGESPTLVDCILVGADASVKEQLKQAPEKINQPMSRRKADPMTDGKKLSPLSAAVFSARLEIFELLIQNGADPAQKEEMGNFLHALASGNFPNLELLRFLLKNYALNPNEKNQEGLTPLMSLIKRIGIIKKNHSHYYGKKQIDQLNGCLDELLKISDLSQRDSEGKNLLFQTIDIASSPLLAKLVNQYQLDINSKDAQGNTPLIYALKQKSNEDLLEKLISIPGINYEETNNQGESALSIAVAQRNYHAVKYLVSAGASVPEALKEKVAELIDLYDRTVF